MIRRQMGDGDVCPVDPTHGRMYLFSTQRQWCPHAGHRDLALYHYDGLTPVSRPASDVARTEADQATGEPHLELWVSAV